MKLLSCFIIVTAITLVACGGNNDANSKDVKTAASGENVGSVDAVNDFAKELIVDEGCDPRIANAMAPFESDYGECTMPKFEELCGPENVDAGIALIGQVREISGGLNPWVWACVRRMEPKIALVSACQYRFSQTPEVCECSVNESYSAEEDKGLLEWLSFTEANDPQGNQGKFKEWANFSNNGRWEELAELRDRHYKRLERCMG